MTQKVIRIGSSAGITIPSKQLKELGIAVGDEVRVTLEPVKASKHAQLMREYDAFVAEYGKTLENLAGR